MEGNPAQLAPWSPDIDREAVEDLQRRLRRTRVPSHEPGWQRGIASNWLAELIADWQRLGADRLREQLDGLRHHRARIAGQELHVVCAAPDDRSLPLLLIHGWPGSFLEYSQLAPLLNATAGEGAASGFNVVIPSLPGFGFSGPPPAEGLNARQTAGLFHRLMREAFGFERYVVHGSDLGAGIAAWLAREYPDEVAGVHLATPGLAVPPGPRSDAEERFAAEVVEWTSEEGGYAHEHATKPATLAVALNDSPAGLAAWIAEKVVAWSGVTPDGEPAFDRGLLLATLTLYWLTGTVGSSLMPYWAYRHSDAALPADSPSPVPTAVTLFGGERVPFPKPPRELAQRFYNVTGWAEHPVGGHFPAVAEPQLLADTLRRALLTD